MKYAAQRLRAKRIARALRKANSPSAIAREKRRKKLSKAMWYAKQVPEGMTADEYLAAVVDAGVDRLVEEARRRRRKRRNKEATE